MRFFVRTGWMGLVAALLSSCVSLLPAPKPLPTVRFQAEGGKARCLVLFLPGALDRDTTFRNEGFFELLKKGHFSADAIAANATIGYYAKGRVVTRLEEDVVGPALTRGYQRVWIVGASMGGMGSFLFSRLHRDQVTGILAIAPFLGDDTVIEEIAQAGGLAHWAAPPPANPMTQQNYQREIWRWLQALTSHREPGPELYLGFGDSDRLVKPDTLLADALPKDHVFHAVGGHEWSTWHTLFADFLDHSTFTRDCR